MSLAILYGLPAQIKNLLDRITVARAGNLDNIDAATSSRAPASTALSTATWTAGRAGNLDNLNASVATRAAASTALSTATWTTARANKLDNLDNLDAAISAIPSPPLPVITGNGGRAATTSTSLVTVLNTTGSGALMSITSTIRKASGTGASPAPLVRVVADGVNVFGDVTGPPNFDTELNCSPALQISGPILFSSTLLIEHRVSGGISDGTVYTSYAVMKET